MSFYLQIEDERYWVCDIFNRSIGMSRGMDTVIFAGLFEPAYSEFQERVKQEPYVLLSAYFPEPTPHQRYYVHKRGGILFGRMSTFGYDKNDGMYSLSISVVKLHDMTDAAARIRKLNLLLE